VCSCVLSSRTFMPVLQHTATHCVCVCEYVRVFMCAQQQNVHACSTTHCNTLCVCVCVRACVYVYINQSRLSYESFMSRKIGKCNRRHSKHSLHINFSPATHGHASRHIHVLSYEKTRHPYEWVASYLWVTSHLQESWHTQPTVILEIATTSH